MRQPPVAERCGGDREERKSIGSVMLDDIKCGTHRLRHYARPLIVAWTKLSNLSFNRSSSSGLNIWIDFSSTSPSPSDQDAEGDVEAAVLGYHQDNKQEGL